jgi:predicted DNA-binding protein
MDSRNPAKKPAKKQLICRVPAELHQRLKIYAVRTDRPMAELVELAVRQFLDRAEGKVQ